MIIDDHLLMRKEIAIQSGIIAYLNRSRTIDLNDIQILLQIQNNNKKSNLDL